jgi:hypothetical protein
VLLDELDLRASPRVSAKVPGRPVEWYYSLMKCSTNISLNLPIKEGPTQMSQGTILGGLFGVAL